MRYNSNRVGWNFFKSNLMSYSCVVNWGKNLKANKQNRRS